MADSPYVVLPYSAIEEMTYEGTLKWSTTKRFVVFSVTFASVFSALVGFALVAASA